MSRIKTDYFLFLHRLSSPRYRTRSLMDKIKDSGSLAQGSIPCGFTTKHQPLIDNQSVRDFHFNFSPVFPQKI